MLVFYAMDGKKTRAISHFFMPIFTPRLEKRDAGKGSV